MEESGGVWRARWPRCRCSATITVASQGSQRDPGSGSHLSRSLPGTGVPQGAGSTSACSERNRAGGERRTGCIVSVVSPLRPGCGSARARSPHPGVVLSPPCPAPS